MSPIENQCLTLSNAVKLSAIGTFTEKITRMYDVDILNTVDWDTWFYAVGMPPYKPSYDQSLVMPSQQLCDRWSTTSDADLSQFSADDIKKFSSDQKRLFVYKVLLLENPVSLTKVKKMEELYHFNAVRNSEIRNRWLLLCLKVHWEDTIPYALKFINEQGRMRFVRPIYRALYAWESARDTAIKNFELHRSEMHSITEGLVAKDLHLES